MRTLAWGVVVIVVLLAAGPYPVRTASVQSSALPLPSNQRGPEPAWGVWQVPKAKPVVRRRGFEAMLGCIRHFESRGRYGAVSATGRFRGAYQFDLPTWRSVGGVGDPAEASVAEQDLRAALLLRRRGLQPWPTPARRCA